MASLWLVNPATLKQPAGSRRKIGRKPLIDLAGLQAAINNGVLGDDDVWLATRRCEMALQNLPWSMRDLLDCLRCMSPYPQANHDFKGAEWCQSSDGQWFPCDAYAIRYDESRRCRSANGLEFYLKFSIDEDNALTLVMISAHT